MTAYYNEVHPDKARWLRALISDGIIARGDVDERSIDDVAPADVQGYTQCHWFAGIGIWSYALRLAGWPDNKPVWTGSCPCQSFSSSGKRAGFDDERHLWPAWQWIIAQCRPDIVFGEQVSSKDAMAWLDLVSSDMEGEGYAIGALDLCAAGVGAPHIRQRLYWVAESESMYIDRREKPGNNIDEIPAAGKNGGAPIGRGGRPDGLANTEGERCGEARPDSRRPEERITDSGESVGVGDPESKGCQRGSNAGEVAGEQARSGFTGASGASAWSETEWLHGADGKLRPIKPGISPLVNGAAERVLRVFAYGDGIVAPQAAEFVKAYMAEQQCKERVEE